MGNKKEMFTAKPAHQAMQNRIGLTSEMESYQPKIVTLENLKVLDHIS